MSGLSRMKWGVVALLCLMVAACGTEGTGGNPPVVDPPPKPTEVKHLSGTAAVGKALADTEVIVKDRTGKKLKGKTDANGKYDIDVTDMTEPYLVKVVKIGDDEARTFYAAAATDGVTNLHALSDVSARNWFAVHSRNIDQAFDDENAIANPPTADELTELSRAIRTLLRIAYIQFGVSADFDFDHTPFSADSNAFDKLLDNLHVIIEKNKITIQLRDPTTGVPGYIVIAFDLSESLATPDTAAPTLPTGLQAFPASTTGMVVVWNSSRDNTGVAGYNVYRGVDKIATSPYPVFSDTGLLESTRYCYTVEAFDGANNKTVETSSACATTLGAPDIASPKAPQSLSAAPIGTHSLVLAWLPSPENDVLGYDIFRGLAGAAKQKIATTVASGFTDSGLKSGTEYCYQTSAFDATLNRSILSDETCVTTSTVDPQLDTTAPKSLATPAGGPYTTAQNVTLTCNDDIGGSGCAAIYYTVDGSEPSTFSSVYTQPLVISANTTLRFFAVDQAGNVEAPIHTESYVIYASVSSFTNGSFEQGPVIPGIGWLQLPGGSILITGWTVLGTSIDIIGSGVSASDGTRTVDLDGGNSIGGGIQQSFTTVPGQTYLVTFDLAGNTGGLPQIKQVSVAIDSFVQPYTFDISGQTATTLKWQPKSFSFTASTTNSTLSFTSLTAGPGIYGPLIDHVQVFEEKTNTGG